MGNRSRKAQSDEQYRNNPLRTAKQSLTDMHNSFATQQRRLLNQIQQRMSAQEARRDEETPPSQNPAESSHSQQAPRSKFRTTLRNITKPSKASNAQAPTPKSALRKDNVDSQRGKVEPKEQNTPSIQQEQGQVESPTTESDDDLQLNAPPPKNSITTVEGLSELLFSDEHLKYIIKDQVLYTRFSLFLIRYRPQLIPVLLHFIEIQKAMKALDYANAVAGSLGPFPGDESESQGIQTAFVANKELDERHQRVLDLLMNEALPAQINFSMVDIVTDAMQKAIKGNQQSAVMQNLIGGLTEVFTLTDPTIEDNPIIYASEEFYNMTGYGRDFVIGRNCRFLQGPKTNRNSVHRLKTCIKSGIEISETLLNYRRDGTPFVNLLLVAPLHDNKGNVKYYIGAQVDVTGLVEQGHGLEGFDGFLSSRKKQDGLERLGGRDERGLALQKLAELSEMFDMTENAIVRAHSRSNSVNRDSGYGSSHQLNKSGTTNRRIIFEEETSEEDNIEVQSQLSEPLENKSKWQLAPPGVPTGILPGVYQKYLLLRPAPSLRVIFVSPGLRKLAKLSKKGFLDCVDGSKGTMQGMKEAFQAGVPVSAKVSWKHEDSSQQKGKPKRDTWISATPMLGSDDSIGVWMIVVVQEANPTKPSAEDNNQSATTSSNPETKQQPRNEEKSLHSDDRKKSTASNTETHASNVESPSTPSKSTIQSPQKSTPTANGATSTPKRNSIHSHSFIKSIPFPTPDPDSDYDYDQEYANTRKLSALQDNIGMENRNSIASGKSANGNGEMGRIRISYDTDDEAEKKEETTDDSGVDTVDDDEEGNDGRGRQKERRRGNGSGSGSRSRMETPKGRAKVDVEEKYTPPSMNFWVKPPRPGFPNRMLSVD